MAVDGDLEMAVSGNRRHLVGKGKAWIGAGNRLPFILTVEDGCALRTSAVVASDALFEASVDEIAAAPGLFGILGPRGSTVVVATEAPVITAKLKGKAKLTLKPGLILGFDGDIDVAPAEGTGMGELVTVTGKGRVHYSS